ncbi:MAG TPA: HAD family hydrolase [Chloroflexota bacterium]|nr:HAD family hydrolase [Chloroflexota bacterium]
MDRSHLEASDRDPRVISFDLDGVIMRGAFNSALRPRIVEHIGRGATLSHLTLEERERHIWLAVRQEHDRRLGAGDFVGAWNWQAIYDRVSHGFGGEPMPDLASIVREACLIDDAVALLPGAWRGLQRLKSAGLRLVAITNGYRCFQWPVLERLGVSEWFESVLTPDFAGFAKPDPRMFGLVPGLVAHVGDLLLHDVLGANLAGVQSIWLDADLPADLLHRAPIDRVREPAFIEYLQKMLEESRYLPFHPEATLETCTPTAVVRDVDEAATVLLESNSAWTPASI